MPSRKPWYQTLFERDYYDYFFVGGPRGVVAPEDYARYTEEQVDFLVRALDLPERARVLDLACGHGRHAIPLAQRGFRVAGLDLSAYHLRLARAAARRAGVEVEWLERDMRDIPGRGRFDAVINCFTAFGYFDEEAEDQRVLDGVARALRPGGRFVIDLLNHDWLMRNFRANEWSERRDGGLVLNRRRYDIHRGRITVDMLYVTPEGKRRKRWHSVRSYTCSELSSMLARAGLAVRNTWGNWDGSKLSMESNRMIVMAEKT